MKPQYFCVTHKEPAFPLPANTILVWLGEAAPPSNHAGDILMVRDRHEDLDFYRPMLLGSAGFLAIKRFLDGEKISENKIGFSRIVLLSQRKFISNKEIGIAAENYRGMRILDPSKISSIEIEKISEASGPCLVGRPRYFRSYVKQYLKCHHLEDFLRFTAGAVERNVLTPYEAVEFLNCEFFVPGGIELGVFDLSIWTPIADKIDVAISEFLSNHRPVNFSPYQRRAASFCAERLGSYLLAKNLSEHNRFLNFNVFRKNPFINSNPAFGTMVTVSGGNRYIAGK